MKINKFKFTALTLTCLTIGILMFLIQRNWLIIYWNFDSVENQIQPQKQDTSSRKKTRIYFWKDEKFKHEDTVIIWNADTKSENLKHLINAWLSSILDERIISKKIDLETVTVSTQGQDAVISLSQTFSWQEWSIFKKYKFIESLLKTIKEAEHDINSVYLLVNGKPLEDTHLNFLQPWPTDGFE
jgi:hypothetical protein